MRGSFRRFIPAAVALAAALALHLAYSPFGYAVVDESMIQAMSRRILDGQVPHRDFIFSRPALTPLLQVPLLALESQHLMLMSRFWWWLEMAATAFLWTAIIGRHFVALRDLSIRTPLSILALMLSVHVFPPMTWYTTDGVFFATLGYWLLTRDPWPGKAFGGLLLGLAVLSKQNFAAIPVLVLLFEQRWWALLAGLPGAAYLGFVALLGGLPDFTLQAMGHTDFVTPGFRNYAHSMAALGVPGTLADPAIRLFSGATPTDFNDNWQTASNAAEITASGQAPSDPKEAAILTTVNPGVPYTVHLTGVSETTGIAIVEVFELDRPEDPLLNISTRGPVLTGDHVMIAGFIIQGDAPQQVLIIAKGPSLGQAPFNVPGSLPDPRWSSIRREPPLRSTRTTTGWTRQTWRRSSRAGTRRRVRWSRPSLGRSRPAPTRPSSRARAPSRARSRGGLQEVGLADVPCREA